VIRRLPARTGAPARVYGWAEIVMLLEAVDERRAGRRVPVSLRSGPHEAGCPCVDCLGQLAGSRP